MSKSVDLTSLTGWANLADGTHNITVVAKATGYQDSDPSAAVQVTKGATIEMPNKGDIITLDSKLYRVLKTTGTIAEVLCMYDANSSIKFDSNSSYNNTYANKNIDTYCNNTFYSGLSSAMKSAIVDKTFAQDSWLWSSNVPTESHYTGKYGSSTYYLTLSNAAYGDSITRHCYCLSVQDVLDYLEATTSMGTSDTTLTDTNIWQMFWNATSSQSDKYIWLRSADASDSDYAFCVYGDFGDLDGRNVSKTSAARPAFQIDLSKVEWTSGGGTVTETDITSTVSAFNISLKLNDKKSVNLQSTLGGGNGTYAATIEDTSVATPTVDGNILNVYSDTTSSATTKVVVTSGSKSLEIPVNVTYQTCFTGDTLITMYDGTTKRIDQIELGDEVLSLDKDGNKVPGYVYYCDSHCNNMGKHYDRFVFEDGTELKIVHRHRFYNMNEKKFVHLDLWYAGDEAYKLDGTTTALKETHLRDYEGDIPHYTLFCEHNTYFANGLLCGNRFSDPVDFNKGISTFANTTYEDSAIVLTLPETFEGYEDAWLDANTLDLMLKKDGQTINYYQVGYANTYGAIYKKPSDDAAIDYDTIISSWEKICDIPTSEGSNCVNGKTFDVVIIYVKRPSRSDGIAVQSLDGGGSQSSTEQAHDIQLYTNDDDVTPPQSDESALLRQPISIQTNHIKDRMIYRTPSSTYPPLS